MSENKLITLKNLETFKQGCDRTYAAKGESGGGSQQLYQHNISFSLWYSTVSFTIINNKDKAYYNGEILEYLNGKGWINCNGYRYDGSNYEETDPNAVTMPNIFKFRITYFRWNDEELKERVDFMSADFVGISNTNALTTITVEDMPEDFTDNVIPL